MQDPETYLGALGVELVSFLDESRHAILDSAHRSRVNWEVFFFADQAEKQEFDRHPERYCGPVTDPVNRVRFHPHEGSPRLMHAGQPFLFSSDSTRALFAALPDSFALPRLGMVPKPESP